MFRRRLQIRPVLRRPTAAASVLAVTSVTAGTAALAVVVTGPVSADPRLSAAAPTAAAPSAITPPAFAPPASVALEPWDVNTTGAAAGAMFETFAPDGSISLQKGGPYRVPKALPVRVRSGDDPVVTEMHRNGDSGNRIDLVFVGDGYTSADQETFDASAEAAWHALTDYEPYKTYQNFFNASRVNIVSPVGGISNDPTDGVTRETPLGMYFWCHDIERLLCVNTTTASAYASLFPGTVHVIALAHTTTYGGSGGAVTTLAGENPASDLVIVHEMAHTLAKLGDEYQIPYDRADGDPAHLPNSSAEVAQLMVRDKSKWYRWLGKPSADGGLVGAYEGSNYSANGYYRPSVDSDMRTLGRPFNPPSIEALIKSFYKGGGAQKSIDPIDSATPAPDDHGVTNRNTTLSITVIPLVGRTYSMHWAVNGKAVPNSTGSTSLKLTTAPLTKHKWNQVSVYVVDDNPAVLDEDFRKATMTSNRTWWVWGG